MTTKVRRIRQALAFCSLLFFPFNNNISGKILFKSLNPCIFLAVGFLLLIPDIRKKISRKTILLVVAEIITVLLIILTNKASVGLGYILIQLAYLLFLPILMNVDIDKKAATIAMTIFTIEHIIGTFFSMIFPGIYEANFLPFVCGSDAVYCPARRVFESGMNAGFTGQSTTNGCYMAIFALFHASRFLDNRDNKKSLFLTIVTLICLLVIGKRAHFLFTVIALFFTYIFRKNKFKPINFIKNSLKIIAVGIALLLGIMAVSNVVPQVGTTIDRIVASGNSKDMTSGRGRLYELAIEKWQESPVFGNGWGSYIVASHEKFGSTTYGSDYMRAHNDYLELLCDVGLFGVAIYLIFLIWVVRGVYYIRNDGYFQKFSFAYMIFFVLYGLTGTPLYIISNFVFLLVAILIRNKENEKSRRDNI